MANSTVTLDRTQAAIQLQSLSKRYRQANVLALQEVDLKVSRGEIFGFLGPNGAGKTTAIRILLDFIRPTNGSAKVFGLDSQRDSVAIHRRIGFLPGELNLWPTYTAQEVIAYLAKVRGGVDPRYVTTLAERLDLDLSKPLRNYSTGNKRKIGLLIALMHRPELVILDEPTSGLDPLMQHTFNQLMLEIKAEGRTVFLSSHMLNEVQAICDRVAIIRQGQLQKVESVADLTRVNFRWVTLHCRQALDLTALQQVAGISEITSLTHAHDTIKFRLQGDLDPLLKAISTQYVIDLKIQDPTLEEIFLSFYGNSGNVTQRSEVSR
jgi:ABC-2 type transport system ATP-binding protein